MYKILKGYTFGADRADYVIVCNGKVIFRDADKAKCEAKLAQLVKG